MMMSCQDDCATIWMCLDRNDAGSGSVTAWTCTQMCTEARLEIGIPKETTYTLTRCVNLTLVNLSQTGRMQPPFHNPAQRLIRSWYRWHPTGFRGSKTRVSRRPRYRPLRWCYK